MAPLRLEGLQRARRQRELVRREVAQVFLASRRQTRSPGLPEPQPRVELAQAVRIVELCSDDRSDAERQQLTTVLAGKTFEHIGDRQVRRAPRLMQPLLAD